MDNDDRQIGRILTRRELLKLLSASSVVALVGCGTDTTGLPTATVTAPATNIPMTSGGIPLPNCVVQPELAEGPFYVDVNLLRPDIREDQVGLPLDLTVQVVQVGEDGCIPLADALVEIWHCNLEGVYSGVIDRSSDTTGQTWLRGAQMTDADGNATITTIYPGWYPGRCVHIHFKVFPAENMVFTSQLYFPDEFNTQVFTRDPYTLRGQPDRVNRDDGLYHDSLVTTPAEAGDGYTAHFVLGVDLSEL